MSYTNRRHAWFARGEQLRCPRGHKLHPNAVQLDHTALICQHREGGQGECGLRVYVVVIPGGKRFVAEVTTGETRVMAERGMSAAEVFEFLTGGAENSGLLPSTS